MFRFYTGISRITIWELEVLISKYAQEYYWIN